MTLKEMNLRVFRGEPLPQVFWQPRFEPWFDWHRQFESLPAQLQGLKVEQAYDMVGASMRYVQYYTGQPDPIKGGFTGEVKKVECRQGELLKTRFDTPHGSLFQTQKLTVDKTWRTIEFAAKTAEDLPALLWLVQRHVYSFNKDNFRAGTAYLGERGEPQFWVPKSPYFSLAQRWMKYTDFIFALADRPDEVEEIMRAIDDSYDALYEQILASGLCKIINFAENIAMAFLSTRYFEQYCIPWYEKRSNQFRRAGIFTHIHIDGYFKPLLPYLAKLPFDGLEALTPEPQGDVTLEEMKEYIGDKVLLDGIPAVYFMEHMPFEELQACVEKAVNYFHPRLVLGISDELPEGTDEKGFERMRWVGEYARSHGKMV